MEGGLLATTTFAVPEPEPDDLRFHCDTPPVGLAVHRSVYRDEEVAVSFTFVTPIVLVPLVVPPLDPASLS